ncbi:hypothetical protein R2F61_00160 [Mollicutes bacterium LVI A0078]|nr:hypothetical protein RZE84_00160 [Mollicutes bacterium LVI A0075]WOO90993.1 hypothetical protein R2F61_00160 [Mollicutes bacterium LVI A0078]
MHNDRLSILLPANTILAVDNTKINISHMQIKKNDKTKRYELRFFEEAKQVAKKQYHNMTINVISSDEDNLSMHIMENGKSNALELLFETEKDVLRIKKYVDTLLI